MMPVPVYRLTEGPAGCLILRSGGAPLVVTPQGLPRAAHELDGRGLVRVEVRGHRACVEVHVLRSMRALEADQWLRDLARGACDWSA